MRQLRHDGWIHHLARHAVACFLTRGDLYQSWLVGAAVFDRLLVDADWAINTGARARGGAGLDSRTRTLAHGFAGSWMWLSASAYFTAYFRVYSPVAFGKHTDPDGAYIRKWLPEVRGCRFRSGGSCSANSLLLRIAPCACAAGWPAGQVHLRAVVGAGGRAGQGGRDARWLRLPAPDCRA